MRRVFLPLIVLIVALSCDTPDSLKQNEADYFLKFYGLDGNQSGVDFVVNTDGTAILLGNSRVAADSSLQVFVVKTDTKGKVIWQKTFGDKNLNEEAKDIELLSNGNLIVAGNAERVKNGDRDVYLLLLSQDGSLIKESRQGLKIGAIELDEDVNSVTEITPGISNPAGFIVAGSTTGSKFNTTPSDTRDAMHMRFASDLTRITGTWSDIPTFGGGGFLGEDIAVKVVQFGPNDYYVFGYTNVRSEGTSTTTDFDFWIYGRTDFGGFFGSPKFIGSSNVDEKLTSVSSSPIASGAGAGYILAGSLKSTLPGTTTSDVYMVRLNKPISLTPDLAGLSFPPKNLNIKNVGLPSEMKAYNFTTSDGYFVTTNKADGTTSSISLLKLDGSLGVTYDQPFNGAGDDLSGPVIELADGKILTIGTMTLGGTDGQKKMVLIKLNANGFLAP
jgi:Domain of unknown function (DUF5122) beta-propeller